MDEIVLILFLAIIVVLAVVVLLMFMVMSGDNKDARTASDRPVNPGNKGNQGWKSWIAFLGIALLIAFWTIWGALFFLAVVWVLRQNPERASSYTVSADEKTIASRTYTWLFWSPILSIPVFMAMIFSVNSPSATVNQRVLTAMVPLIFHIPLLAGLSSKNVFVYRHNQQGILLMALRAGMASLSVNIETYPADGLWLFGIGNVLLWLLGSIWGWNQISRAECWLMKQKSEMLIITSGEFDELSPQTHIERSREFIGKYKAEEVKNHALAAFRNGDRAVKQQAVQILTNLHEVEKF
jgi:hypothetical protein